MVVGEAGCEGAADESGEDEQSIFKDVGWGEMESRSLRTISFESGCEQQLLSKLFRLFVYKSPGCGILTALFSPFWPEVRQEDDVWSKSKLSTPLLEL